MKKLLPVIIAVIGLAGGLVGGSVLKPEPATKVVSEDGSHNKGESNHADADAYASDNGGHGADHASGSDNHSSDDGHGESADSHGENGGHGNGMVYVGLEKPFFVPVLRKGKKNALVRLDIHLEVPKELEQVIHKHDPKLRDAFLQTVMNFSHEGGFTRVHGGEGFAILRDDLLVSARKILGPEVKTVLIGEILTREG